VNPRTTSKSIPGKTNPIHLAKQPWKPQKRRINKQIRPTVHALFCFTSEGITCADPKGKIGKYKRSKSNFHNSQKQKDTL